MSFETPVYPGIQLDDNYGPTLKAVGVAFTVISAVTVLLRFISRVTTHISVEADDWLLVTGAVLCWAYNAVIMIEADFNFYGQHIGKSDPHHLEEYLKGLYSLAIVYPGALTFSKLSLLALYWRIFRNSSAKRPIQIAAALNIGWMIAAILVGIFSCSPVRGFWDLTIASSCIEEYDFFLTNECLTMVLDIVVLIIPLWSIAQIQRSLSQRISIGSTFALGLGVTILSAIRLWQLVIAQERPGNDPTFNQTGAALWAIVEINVWVVVATIPALRPMFHDFYVRLRSQGESSLTLADDSDGQRPNGLANGTIGGSGAKKSRRPLRNWFDTNGTTTDRLNSREELASKDARGYVVHVESAHQLDEVPLTQTTLRTRRSTDDLRSGTTPSGNNESSSALGRNPDVEMANLPRIRVHREVYVGP